MSAWAAQKVIYARLQPVLAALSPSVALYDDAPANCAFPYVEVARHILTQQDGLDYEQSEDLLTLAIYSQYAGQKEVVEIMRAIRSSLHDARLTLETGTAVSCRYTRMDTARDQDGRTYTGTIIFSVLIEH